MSDVAGIIRAVLEGAVTAASSATGLSKAQSREALLAELGELRETPPRPVDVDVDALDAAFKRGLPPAAPAGTQQVLLPIELLEQLRVPYVLEGALISIDASPRARSLAAELQRELAEPGAASPSPALAIPRLRPELLDRARPAFERAGIHVTNLEPHLAPRPLAIVRALEYSAAAIAVELPDDALRAKALDLIKSSIVLVAAEHPDSRVTEEPPAP